jgi:hypothetical protein
MRPSTCGSIPAPHRRRRRHGVLLGAAVLLLLLAPATIAYLALPASAQIAVRNQGYVPYSDAPINYRTAPVGDPVALLQKRIEQGKAKLTYEDDHGYLKSVLKLLNVPVSSQTLVFSKTSFQFKNIDPLHPRALYYNDDVYVGSVHGGNTIEIISFDPSQGAIFYLVDEAKADKPVFQRAELDCTQCHIAPATRGVPGVFLRSVHTTKIGTLSGRAPAFITDQRSPLKERWGGWYVTGDLAEGSMANATLADTGLTLPAGAAPPPVQLVPIAGGYDKKSYLTPESDPVALLVLGHQTQMHNLITLTNYQTRLALHALAKDGDPAKDATTTAALPEKERGQIERPAEQLIRYLLFAGEAPLGGKDGGKVIASSAFARDFAKRGEKDSKGRSLRDFDLTNRTFRYPASYLIYSAAFDAIPEPAKGYIHHRLLQILSGEDTSPDFAHLSPADRQAILSILLETKPGLPAEWRDYARANRLRVAALPPAGRDKS